jgi:hypothetical protein
MKKRNYKTNCTLVSYIQEKIHSINLSSKESSHICGIVNVRPNSYFVEIN